MSNTFTWNGSTTEAKTWSFSATLKVPPNQEYICTASVTIADLLVPYILKGTAIYSSGARVSKEIEGIYKGTDSYNLQIITKRVSFSPTGTDLKPKSLALNSEELIPTQLLYASKY